MSNDTTVQIKGTFAVKQREHNGLDRVADLVNGDRLVRVPIVGYVTFHKHTETVTGDTLTVSLEAVEPCIMPDGSDPDEHGRQALAMLDRIRRQAGKANVADTLFSAGREKELDGQLEAITRDEVDTTRGTDPVRSSEAGRVDRPGDVNADGDQVPEKSGEEIMAERAEAREKVTAGSAARTAAATARVGGAGSPGAVDPAIAATAQGNVTPIKRTPRKATARPATADPFDKPAF